MLLTWSRCHHEVMCVHQSFSILVPIYYQPKPVRDNWADLGSVESFEVRETPQAILVTMTTVGQNI